MAAFQALGPFISTFADPAITALLHNDNGEIVITDPELLARRLDELEKQRADRRRSDLLDEQQAQEEAVSDDTAKPNDVVDMELCGDDLDRDATANDGNVVVENIVTSVKDRSLEEARAELYQSNAPSDSYNTFQFWREPVANLVLPESLPADIGGEEKSETYETEAAELLRKPSEPEFEEEDEEMEIEPLFGDEDDFEDSRVEELHKLENHLKRVLDKENQEMDHLTKELRDAKLAGNFVLYCSTFLFPLQEAQTDPVLLFMSVVLSQEKFLCSWIIIQLSQLCC